MANKLLGNSGNTNASAADSEVMMTSINKVTHERIGEGNLEPLMGTKNNDEEQFVQEKFGCWYGFKRAMGCMISKERRKLEFDGRCTPNSFPSNKLNNQKFNVFSFIPKVLYNEFKFFFNMFFLVIALSQFVPFLKVGFMFTYVAPLVFVLLVTMLKEGYDDIQRMRRDKELNNTKYELLQQQGDFLTIPAQDIKVGHIIKIVQGQRVPCDMVLLYSTEKTGSVFIKTDQLDGETDWKLRKALPQTQQAKPPTSIVHMPAYIITEPPNDQIYDFKGVFKSNISDDQEGLSLENTIWANTVIASSGYILGHVIHTGVETRMAMNTSSPRQKLGKLDQEVNHLAKVLFVQMFLISFLIIAVDGFYGEWYFKLFRMILLLCAIIPISMRINLDLAKVYYSVQIQSDVDIEGCIARNSTIPEELGRVQFLLSDKTGTLTQNDMIFKKIAMEFAQFSEDTQNELKEMLEESCKESQGPYGDVDTNQDAHVPLSQRLNLKQTGKKKAMGKFRKREQHYVVRDLILALCLCHNVTPVYPDATQPTKKEFQASSPDEIALVKFAEEMGMFLEQREEQYIQLLNPAGVTEEYDILQNFPFSSETKRMGIILRHRQSNKIMFYVKGADVAMINKVKPGQRSTCQEFCENLAMEGLRTLVITHKLITESTYKDFEKRLRAARASFGNREQLIQKVIESLEVDMEYLAVTGVEDKLQEEVLQTIERLRQAGMQIWMLTGDKVETAKCIAISTGLKSNKQGIFEIVNMSDIDQIKDAINRYKVNIEQRMLMVDGNSLAVIVGNEALKDEFFAVAQFSKSVCICRCSPTQKAVVAHSIKTYTGKIIACVGDGGNDVAMIQQADVGIGIVGKEGMQASLAADFSINQFNHLFKLLLWHGRLSYKRSASLSQFVVHRGMIISFIQAIFTCVFFYVTIPIYNGFLLLGYSTVYTSFPIFTLILDVDVDLDKVKQYPALYITLQKGRSLNFKTFMIWTWKSIYQACIIMFVAITYFQDSFTNIVTITFTTLILIELLNVITEVTKIRRAMVLSMIATMAVYLLSIVIFRNYFEVSYIDAQFCLRVVIMTLVCWTPLHLIKKLIQRFDPNQEQKIMRDVN